MSENPQGGQSQPKEAEDLRNQSTFQENGPNNVISIASKQINDVIQFQEPTTSKNYSFKTEIRINILGEPNISEKSNDSCDSIALSLFNNGASDGKRDVMEVEESFATMDLCVKEKTTTTNEATVFSRNDRTQRTIVVNSEAPPPYESRPPPAYSTSPNRPTSPYQQQVISPSPGGGGYYLYDYVSSSSLEIHIRHQFVRKVFFILFLQLLITMGMILLTMFHKPTRIFVLTNMPMFWIMAVTQLVIYITLMCYQAPRRIFPLNFVLLLLFTIAMSYVCAAGTVFYSTQIILITVASTALICLLVTILAFQTWFDITKWASIIAIASIIFVVFSLAVVIVSLFTYSPVLWLVFAGMATMLFSVFLLYDMQCILGGRRHEISPEEYIYATLTLYVDIVLIFMYMLQLVNACSR